MPPFFCAYERHLGVMVQFDFGSGAVSRKDSRFARNDRFRVAVIPNVERDLAKPNHHAFGIILAYTTEKS